MFELSFSVRIRVLLMVNITDRFSFKLGLQKDIRESQLESFHCQRQSQGQSKVRGQV